ncbi:MAG: FtsX-like permease family protein [Lachnospiraceae bacterium]|nr:FtsX-like permease family protein [Lachnospiraceae bacterium]
MLKVMLQKLWHKKWMVLCLLLGCILLIATVVSFPLYRNAAFDRMIKDEFDDYVSEKGLWPAMNSMLMIAKNDREGKSIVKLENAMAEMDGAMGVTERERIYYYSLSKAPLQSTWNRTDLGTDGLRLGFMSNLEKHAKLLSGEMYSESGYSEDGAFEVVVSQDCLVNNNLLVGETFEFTGLADANKNMIRIKIVGVFAEEDSTDFYWQVKPSDMGIVALMKEDLFREYFLGENAYHYSITCQFFNLFEYDDITAEKVDQLMEKTVYYTEESAIRKTMSKPEYRELLENYLSKRTRIEAALFILQVPVLILLCAFLFMISGQMYDMERNEISVMKSRGGSSSQMFRLYLYQSTFLTLLGAAAGIPLGTVFCRLLGSTQNFLEFNVRRQLNIKFDQSVWSYAIAAAVGCVLIMTIPALKHSRLTIVKLKQSNALRKRSWWEKIFLDVILLGISLYGYYNFSKNQGSLAASVMEGQTLDPLLYLSSSLFIVGMGLLFLRLQPLVIHLIYLMGKRFWKPASYASFMENVKNGRKQQFIMLFMILTISLGMYHAVVARTILQNAKENTEYLEPVDIVIKEVWNKVPSSTDNPTDTATAAYMEPDYSRFASMPGVEAYTKVFLDERGSVKTVDKTQSACTILGIHTKEYGTITNLEAELTGKPYREYLNELAVAPDGVLLSANFRDVFGYKVGDSVEYKDRYGTIIQAKIVDFFDYWPGYEPTSITVGADGTAQKQNNLLVIANFATIQKNLGIYPYEIWAKLEPGATSDAIYEWIKEKNIHVVKYADKAAAMRQVVQDPLLQGTNGVLTMGFIVTIILCAVGYLIYWIMSIRSREMIFGVLRACGMHKGELFHMLINEQIFSGVLSIFAGIGIGTLTSRMFVPMLQTAYAASNQVLPMKLIVNQTDMNRLYLVIAGVMALCLLTLITLVFKMNVTKALKLGEE